MLTVISWWNLQFFNGTLKEAIKLIFPRSPAIRAGLLEFG